ncbi:hypothetical protein BH11GEM1_BH11GEM1_09170 [soil metagenome]
MTRRLLLALLTATWAGACGGESATTPTGATTPVRSAVPFAILAGNNASDTVDAILPQALVVELNANGRARVGVPVRFDVVRDTGASPMALLQRTTSTLASTRVTDTTDALGHARVVVQLGQRSGTGRIGIAVLEANGGRDTARYVVRPGRAQVTVATRYIEIAPGSTYALGVSAVDRRGNRAPVSFLAGPYVAAVDTAGRVTVATSGGSGFVVARTAYTVDTARFTALPRDRLAVIIQSGSANRYFNDLRFELGTVELTGNNRRRFNILSVNFPVRSPVAEVVAFSYGVANGQIRIDVVDSAGARRTLVDPARMFSARLPHFSADGRAVHFLGRERDTSATAVWRVDVNSGALQRLAVLPMVSYSDVSVSPDGSRIAYFDSATADLAVQDLRTSTVTLITDKLKAGPFLGLNPAFSPDGRSIAFVSTGSANVVIVNSAGGGLRVVGVSPTSYFDSRVSWTKDGAWILARAQFFPILVNALTGDELVVPGAGDLVNVALP